MLETIKKLYSLFDNRGRKIIALLTIATIFVAFIQVVGIGSILPFLTVVANPESVEQNRWLNKVYIILGFTSTNTFLVFLGVGSLLILTFGNVFMIGTQWIKYRFIHTWGHMLSMRLLENYLDKPYIFFLNQNSSDLNKEILWEVKLIVSGLLKPTMEMLSHGMIVLFIILFLIILNPILSLAVVILLGGSYVLIFIKIKNKLYKLGEEREDANDARFKITAESFGAIKDIKVMNSQKNFLRIYEKPSFKFERTQASEEIYSMVPIYILETIAFGGILIVVLYLLLSGGDIAQTLPIIGLYAYSILRLQPALKIIYKAISKFKFYQSTLDEMYNDLKLYTRERIVNWHHDEIVKPMPFREKIYIDRIHFRYPSAKDELFSGLNLIIYPNTSVAFVGSTGSGKTTLVDIILGLLPPDNGRLIVDNTPITPDNLRNWQRSLGYVPQNIFLADDSVKKNIAFGIPEKEIDNDRVIQAARMACIHNFIVNEMSDEYETVIGENGIRLSGGQRQRIGIARALYRNPDILILDEATSALDSITEENVFQAIENITKTKTVIMIAHRLTTIRGCDRIYFLEQGKIIAEGTYDELIDENARFKKFAKVNVKVYDPTTHDIVSM